MGARRAFPKNVGCAYLPFVSTRKFIDNLAPLLTTAWMCESEKGVIMVTTVPGEMSILMAPSRKFKISKNGGRTFADVIKINSEVETEIVEFQIPIGKDAGTYASEVEKRRRLTVYYELK